MRSDVLGVTGIDTGHAHPARVYDYWLGGKDNYAADREVAQAMQQLLPETGQSCQDNRGFLTRAVEYVARELGIRQFLDIGTGLPTSPSVHEIAQHVAPESRVVYVDNDPIVLVHARALLRSSSQGRTAYIQADLREPGEILRQAAETLDFGQPVAVLLVAIMHFVGEADDPYGIVRRLLEPLPAGSALVLSHMTGAGADDEAAEHVKAVWAGGGVPLHMRGREGIAGFFDGLGMVDPGIVPVHQWRPEVLTHRRRWWLLAGTGVKAGPCDGRATLEGLAR